MEQGREGTPSPLCRCEGKIAFHDGHVRADFYTLHGNRVFRETRRK